MIKKFYFPLTVSVSERGDCGWSDGCEYDGVYANMYRGAIEDKFDGYNDEERIKILDKNEYDEQEVFEPYRQAMAKRMKAV